MNELILPFKISVRVGKKKNIHNLGKVIIKTRYRISLVLGIWWLSLKIFLIGAKKLIEG